MLPLLAIRDLTVAFLSGEEWTPVVRDVSFSIEAGEFAGLVGESGAGKSAAALAILGLLPANGRVLNGRVELAGRALLPLSGSEMQRGRGGQIAMIFQEPMTALNPVFTVGFQISESVRAHQPLEGRAVRREAERLLDLVAIPAARQRLDDYPHQLSGGQRQRIMIAMALAGSPDLLIADEPTTALDVTVQAQILELLEELRRELNLTILLITHDLAVVAERCTRIGVMYAGEIVEQGASERIFKSPAHPYTRALLAVVPRLGLRPTAAGLPTIPGQVPDPRSLPPGCAFHPRCEAVLEACNHTEPTLYSLGGGHAARCFLHQPEVADRESRP
jgi:peptide/nickel transport system ATP-binding protein